MLQNGASVSKSPLKVIRAPTSSNSPNSFFLASLRSPSRITQSTATAKAWAATLSS
jgi:hypothetical protein